MTTSLFTAIAELVPTLDGWCTPAKAQMLAAAVLTLRPETTVEIGVFAGRSLLPLALAHKEIGRGYVYGIDPWNPTDSRVGQLNPGDFKFWTEVNHEEIYAKFIANVERIGVMDVMKIIRKPSDHVEPPAVIDILHSDGNHGDQALRDAQRFAPRVRVGGLCFLDDLDWTGGAVRRAEAFIKSIGFKLLSVIDTGALYQRL